MIESRQYDPPQFMAKSPGRRYMMNAADSYTGAMVYGENETGNGFKKTGLS